MKRPAIILAIGVLLFLVSLTADSIGIGEGTGIGWKQILGSVAGLVIAAVGIVQMRRTKT